jgi:putative signal transducing protein
VQRLVPVVRVGNSFHARVIAARLGSEGFVTQLRGEHASPYPMGEVEVLVDEADLDDAVALLLADEVESSFDDPPEPAPPRRLVPWVVVAVVIALLVLGDVVAVAVRP